MKILSRDILRKALLLLCFMMPAIVYSAEGVQDNNETRNQYLKKVEEQSPVLYAMEKKLDELQHEIQNVVVSYRKKEIDGVEAVARLKPLVREQMEIRDSKDYQQEQVIYSLLFKPSFMGEQGSNAKKEQKATLDSNLVLIMNAK